ncbi:ral GTPase-activating protein subunit beta isoform X2 [Chelonus insularis]|uniref:ral GTPase-activating protein subunit beta isoform X2 n=1 Tax=Chelonus insularis TaxID=460826 RepID=UPI00158DED5E|nr:ral GTPase-activating protein subunit beta isoform X2 [Chelonus insularis]
MNLGVFNRVNLKDSGGGMYSEWASLSALIQRGSEESRSVLEKFSPGAGREVALPVVRQLAANLGITQAAEPSPLNTDKEVQWCMEVICFGLSLPLAEHDTVRDCVNVYCEWLSALYVSPKISVPKPIVEDPNFYARKMISHFHNLFVPRKGEVWPFLYQDLGADTINRQAVLCHRVLRTLQQVARGPATLDNETWESLLLFLIGINDALLAPPAVREDAGEQLCERVLGVLLEVWLVACERNFPSPPLWRTLRESCLRWRHRLALIEQWNRVCLALTARLLNIMYGPLFPELKISEEDAQVVPPTMSDEAVAQAWYRLLRTVGDPVDLCRPAVVSQTQAFLQYAIASPYVIDPCHHPCLQSLPQIFLKAIKGIAGQVDAFLGVSQACCWEECCATSGFTSGINTHAAGGGVGAISSKDQPQSSPTPPTQRRLAKSFSVTPSAVTKGIPKASLIGLTSSRLSSTPPTIANSGPSSTSSTTSITSLGQDIRPPLAPGRPKCNSILHLFGEWLFEAAFIGTDGWSQNLPRASKRPSSVLVEGPSSLQETITEIPSTLSIDRYESGRAEAMGALCRIFCAKKTGEEILPVYLARFYQAMYHGLKVDESRECGETLASILSNSADLFRLDLDGVEILIPAVINALELVLPDKDLKLKSTSVSKIELRRASIQLLISMLVLPLHFQNLFIRELPIASTNLNNTDKPQLTFGQLKPRLMNLLINALQVETDPLNTHMLLGGLLLSVQDSATVEEVEHSTVVDTLTNDTSTNLLSSVSSDSTSQISISSDLRSLGETSDVETVQEESPSFDSAHALFLRATYLVCHRLISSWKTDLNISLAALELLSGLARTKIRETDALECKRAVKWLCDYITYQCWRPPPAHSKDLHSSIVAAFSCLTTWLTAHPQLLQDKDCLTTVFEVVELGISGSKSIGKPGEPIKMKHEKELKPASMRVRDAADALLTIILEQVGYFPSACGAQSLSSLLDEVSLLQHCNSNNSEKISRQTAVEHFRFFVAENATMLALLEDPLVSDKTPQPTVTALIRGPFGRHAWTMHLRHLPRHKSGIKSINFNPGRPLSLIEPAPRSEYKPRFFPDNVDKIPHCKVDDSIPTLEAVMNDDDDIKDEHQVLSQLLDRQINLELRMDKEFNSRRLENDEECISPENCHEFQTARLFLSHFGFLNLEGSYNEDGNNFGIIALDPTLAGFCTDLESLDQISSRTCDTVHIFYVKSGQKNPLEILSNVQHQNDVSQHFLELLSSLGWPVNVSTHAGWTGHVSTSWRVTPPTTNPSTTNSDHGGALFNGETHILYWADVSSEIAFIVPTGSSVPAQLPDSLDEISYNSDTSSGQTWYERSISEIGTNRIGYASSHSYNQGNRTMSLDLEKQPPSLTGSGPSSVSSNQEPTRPRRTTKHSLPWQTDTRIMVVWLESLEDYVNFPVAELLPCTHTGLESFRVPQPSDVYIIFLQALANGLLRVRLQGPVSRMNLATPLIDGMVVSRRVLGTLVRQTALNMGKRRRLDNDSYHPPHVRRRLKIQDIVQKYKKDLSQPELLTFLFNNTTVSS